MKRPGNSKYMKKLNRMNILNIIKRNQAISRQQIAELTGLTPPAITGIIRDLILQGLVKETGLGISQGGRRPVELTFNAQAAYVLGIEITSKETTFAIADLQNMPQPLLSLQIEMSEPKQAVEHLLQSIRQVLASEAASQKKILGIGIAFPGMLDLTNGRVKRAVNLGAAWKDFPFEFVLEQDLGLPVFVETNSKVAALGEKWFGGGIDCENLIYINMGEGISAGIILHDSILQGTQGYAGQIGHMVVDEAGPICRCGNRGCLEAMCGAPALLKKIRGEWEFIAPQDGLRQRVAQAADLTLLDLLEVAIAEDSYAREVLHQAMRYIGLAVATMINFYNPGRVFIGGKLALAAGIFINELREFVGVHVFPEVGDATLVVISKLGADSGVIGACALALEKLLQSPDSKLFAFSVGEEE